MISGYDHVAITVSDLDVSCRFYVDVLGARIDADYKANGRTIVRRVLIGKALINIHKQGNCVERVARFPTPGSADLCFRWQGGIESAVALLNGKGIEILEGPVPRIAADNTQGQSIYFCDPDGNLLELLAT